MARRLKIGLYSPYLDTLGGGERYLFDIASCLSSEYDVYIFWDDNSILSKAEKRFDLKLEKITLTPNIFSKKNAQKTLLVSRKFDVMFYLSDGSMPFLLSKKNYVIFQFPVNWVRINPLLRLKLSRISRLICYSDFVKKNLLEKFNKETIVVPPFIDIKKKNKIKKEEIILTVGRFTKGMNMKKQEILIQTFKQMCDTGLKKWKLIVAGSYREEDYDFFRDLVNQSKHYPIEVLGNISYSNLLDLYNKAKIYWHATGFGENLDKNPERAEHFGITTVEAMRCGVVPVVINAGGQSEIVENNVSGFLWDNLDELKDKTYKLINDESLLSSISKEAEKESLRFGKEEFCKEINELIV